MKRDTKHLLKKHNGHTITIWEHNEWNVMLDDRGAPIGKAEFGIEGGFDHETPLYCHECREEIDWNDEYVELIKAPIEERYDTT